MTPNPGELAERLREEGSAVEDFFTRLKPEQWVSEVYADGQVWRVREVLAHFITAETSFQPLIANPGGMVDFEIDEYNRRTVAELGQEEYAVLLGQFAMVRERTVALVRDLQPEQLSILCRHPALGQVPLREVVDAIPSHNYEHLHDVRRVLLTGSVGRPVETGAA